MMPPLEDVMRLNSLSFRKQLLPVAGIVTGLLLVMLLLPAVAGADELPPLESDPNQCALCHQIEVQDWQSSPHAAATNAIENANMVCEEGEDCTACLTCHSTNFSPDLGAYEHAGVTCEACHGPLAEGHPEEGAMALSVNSSVCRDCHVETFEDWGATPHAQAGVQCIGCHRSHTQNLRLDDQALCKSCHREQLQDGGHLAHLRTGLDCVSCHTSPASSPHVTNGPSAPSHQFAVNTAVCADCHSDVFRGATANTAASAAHSAGAPAAMQGSGAASPEALVAEQSLARRLTQTSAVALGIGIGVGALAGIVFMLAAAILIQRPWRGKS
ncbi:MAG: multiheme c-type cytochrome [Anaerolineae bacterium]